MITGVYRITNKVTGDFYVGSSKNIKHRWYCHKCPSRWARCPNSKLYQDMAQYGLNNFTFEILEETDSLREREQYYIEQLKPTYNNYRANGLDIERYKEYNKEYNKEYQKEYYNRLCLYNGEIINLNALSLRFYKQGMSHPTLEAKKYLLAD